MTSQCFFKHLEYIARVESLGPTCIVFHFIFFGLFLVVMKHDKGCFLFAFCYGEAW
jgi:hypothetical protein